jgi:rhodanese-related sulfurtransferase
MALFGFSFGGWASAQIALMPATDVHARVEAGTIMLVDVRTPNEWLQTGMAEGAAGIMLQAPEFMAKLDALTSGAKDTPIAFICRVGARSGTAAKIAMQAGYTEVYNVPHGTMTPGGWIANGLPMVSYQLE